MDFAEELSPGVGVCGRGPGSSATPGAAGGVSSLFWPFLGLQGSHCRGGAPGRSVGGRPYRARPALSWGLVWELGGPLGWGGGIGEKRGEVKRVGNGGNLQGLILNTRTKHLKTSKDRSPTPSLPSASSTLFTIS